MYGQLQFSRFLAITEILDLFWIVPGLFLVDFLCCIFIQVTEENKIDDDGSGIS